MCWKVQNTRAQLQFSRRWTLLRGFECALWGVPVETAPLLYLPVMQHTLFRPQRTNTKIGSGEYEKILIMVRKLEVFAIPEIVISIGGCLTVWLVLSAKKVEIWVGSVGDQIVFIVRPAFYSLTLPFTGLRFGPDRFCFRIHLWF